MRKVCQRAKTGYKGRDWAVWFAPDIPISEGPWLLRGLPGLVLEANDGEHHYVFKCVSVEQVKGKKFIEKEKNEKYPLVSKKDFTTLRRRFFETPLEMPGAELSVADARKLKRKYSPIERKD